MPKVWAALAKFQRKFQRPIAESPGQNLVQDCGLVEEKSKEKGKNQVLAKGRVTQRTQKAQRHGDEKRHCSQGSLLLYTRLARSYFYRLNQIGLATGETLGI